jgi:hypothetical protein
MIAFNETHRGMLAGFGIGLLVLATAIYALVNFNKKKVQL